LAYRWFSAPNARVLDPFCGGSVRGVVASHLQRRYTGVDISGRQIDANKAQTGLCSGPPPWWLVGDATNLDACLVGYQYDMIFSCPPYADLEVYSTDPRDISTWSYHEFLIGYRKAIFDACARLQPHRYAVWVIGDVRDKDGTYRGLHHETVDAFAAAGLRVINELVMVDPAGTAPARAGRPFEANRKVTLTHQHFLVFVKGDVRRAADWCQAHG
jgi:DNA modification methylase